MKRMKNSLWALIGCVSPFMGIHAQSWKPQTAPIMTRWAKEVTPQNAHAEYPRPQLVRNNNWNNLNGLWQYAITDKDANMPTSFEGQILVPFPLESALSGVKKALLPIQTLWYKRQVNIPAVTDKKVLLHFGAVDWQTTVFVNGKQVGEHTGGYTGFTFDITSALNTGQNDIVVKVYDPTDEGVGPHGKQVLKPENIYYTATSGIWQTVWLETVPVNYITSLQLTPDIDSNQLKLAVNAPEGYEVIATAKLKGKEVGSVSGNTTGEAIKIAGEAGNILRLKIAKPEWWSPANPVLYDLEVKLVKNGVVADAVSSYFGMRKISVAKDEKGVERIFLNNRPYFNLGTLDQGFWPDGLYTAPTDEALAFDIKAIKAMGFNTIRKHIKVEPDRWYYYADKLGMLVWQDFVNPNQDLPEGSKAEFEREAAEEMTQLHNYPSIVVWVLFNEKWGQFDQQRLTDWVKQTDPSRIVNGHTGEILYVNDQLRSPSPNAYVDADMTDIHAYPNPMMPVKDPGKAQVLGEFGGIGVFIPDHQWLTGSAWGYIQEKPAALQPKYTVMSQGLQLLEKQGLSGSIYTQPFDVEGEQNGLITYDREVVKMPLDSLVKIHAPLNPEMGVLPKIAIKNADLTDPVIIYAGMFKRYLSGERNPAFLKKMAMMAAQSGDKLGGSAAGSDYIVTLKGPLSEDDIAFVTQFTQSTTDPGFKVVQQNADLFKKTLGERNYAVNMMNWIYKGEIAPVLERSAQPDWTALAEKVKPYGEPGMEILLKAETIDLYSRKDWSQFVPVAQQYLQSYGVNLTPQEKQAYQQAISAHQ